MFLRQLFGSRVLWIGLALLVLGTGPLLVTIALDPKANPVGFGMLTFFTFWPSILMIVIGLCIGAVNAARGRVSRA